MSRIRHRNRPGRESVSKRLGKALSTAIKVRDGFRCVYCGIKPQDIGQQIQLDHVIPRSKGGSDSPDNIVCSCRKCNRAKSSKDLRVWIEQQGFSARRREQIIKKVESLSSYPTPRV